MGRLSPEELDERAPSRRTRLRVPPACRPDRPHTSRSAVDSYRTPPTPSPRQSGETRARPPVSPRPSSSRTSDRLWRSRARQRPGSVTNAATVRAVSGVSDHGRGGEETEPDRVPPSSCRHPRPEQSRRAVVGTHQHRGHRQFHRPGEPPVRLLRPEVQHDPRRHEDRGDDRGQHTGEREDAIVAHRKSAPYGSGVGQAIGRGRRTTRLDQSSSPYRTTSCIAHPD